MIQSGRARLDISGNISEDIYAYYLTEGGAEIPVANPVVAQGKRTINKQIILNAAEKFKYTLTTAEAVIVDINSVDGNDVTITVFEYGKTKEYEISGDNRFGRRISFKN
jgi:outer membrane lipopolysaccharide assembly protein LptE/RlpB